MHYHYTKGTFRLYILSISKTLQSRTTFNANVSLVTVEKQKINNCLTIANAQHKHAQALQGGIQQRAVAQQQDAVCILQPDKTRQHAPFGRAERGQPRFIGAKAQKVAAELAVNELCAIRALRADDAQVRQGRDAVGWNLHGLIMIAPFG